MVTVPSPDPSTADLLKAADKAGVRFRVAGGQLRVTGEVPPEMLPVLDALKGRRKELMRLMGGDAGQSSIGLLAALGVVAVVPETVEEAQALLAELMAHSRRITPQKVQQQGGVWIGADTETAALPGEEMRPPVHLRLRDGLPAAHQPRLKGKAGLDPHRSKIRLLQLYGGGERCLVLDTDKVPLAAVAEVFQSCTLLIHNAEFELRFFAEAGIQVTHFECTMQAASLLLGVHRRSLEDAARAYLGVEVPKALQLSDWSAPVLSKGQIAYAALDAILAFQFWRKARVELHHKGRSAAYTLQRDAIPPTVRMILRGITLDLEAHHHQINKAEVEARSARAAFLTDTGKAPPSTPGETRTFLTEVLPAEVIESWSRTAKTGELTTEGAELRRHLDIPAISLTAHHQRDGEAAGDIRRRAGE
jgi:ribonuclease D